MTSRFEWEDEYLGMYTEMDNEWERMIGRGRRRPGRGRAMSTRQSAAPSYRTSPGTRGTGRRRSPSHLSSAGQRRGRTDPWRPKSWQQKPYPYLKRPHAVIPLLPPYRYWPQPQDRPWQSAPGTVVQALPGSPAPACCSESCEYVRWIQNALNLTMNLRIRVDGTMSPETRSALRQFQRRSRLPPTGFVGPPTQKALTDALFRNAHRTKQIREVFPEELPELVEEELVRDSRRFILWVQSALNKLSGLRLQVDGIAGPETRSAIKSFQRKNGLMPDGIVGSQTKRAMIAAGANPPPVDSARPRIFPAPDPIKPAWIDWTPSPYHSSRRNQPITAVIYHYTAGPSLNGTVRWFQNNPGRVSAHYVVGKDGSIIQMVPLARSAHHAGRSTLPGCHLGVNRCSIGIEIVNWGVLSRRGENFYTHSGRRYRGPAPVFVRGRWWEPYPPGQIASLIRLTLYLLSQFPEISYITGHEDIAPGRKNDPGGAFDWQTIHSAVGPFFRGHFGPLPTVKDQETAGYANASDCFVDQEFEALLELNNAFMS